MSDPDLNSESSSEDEYGNVKRILINILGPVPVPVVKKRKTVQFNDSLYLSHFPCSNFYSRSYTHRTFVKHGMVWTVNNLFSVVASHSTRYIATGSDDGCIKFWYYDQDGVQFVKHLTAHTSAIIQMRASVDGLHLGCISYDKTYKHIDFQSFDLVNIIKLDFVPVALEFLTSENSPHPVVAIMNSSREVHIFKPTLQSTSVSKFEIGTTSPHLMLFNPRAGVCLVANNTGDVDLYDVETFKFPKCSEYFRVKMKSDTDLYEMRKYNTHVVSMSISPNWNLVAMYCNDGMIRIFRFETMKLYRVYDETVTMYSVAQTDPNQSVLHFDSSDFLRRQSCENEISKLTGEGEYTNLLFDSSSNYLMYPCMLGVKIVNIITNKLVRVIGKSEPSLRYMKISLLQHVVDKKRYKPSMDANQDVLPPILIATAFQKSKLYIFTDKDPDDDEIETRDVISDQHGEKAETKVVDKGGKLAKEAIIHTSKGDIHVQLFYNECKKTVENFTVHSLNGYYNGTIFHRVIKNFMIQGGDPTGDGTGGESIWGNEFEDEIHPSLKHDRPFTLAMANSGPNTNGSQFYITTVPCPWLDGKHTVFGRVTSGMDIVQDIEKIPTNKDDKPIKDVVIVSIKPIL
nr:cyclophilin peptidyl-prolyl cis-trans isomerase protein [Theileria orientalis]